MRGYTKHVIRSFRHKGLKLLYEKGERRRVQADFVDKIERILARLDQASEPENVDLPGYRLHPLKGDLAGFWSVTVSGNWRIVFRFEGGHACDVVTAHPPGFFQVAGVGVKVPVRRWPTAWRAVWPWSRAVLVTER